MLQDASNSLEKMENFLNDIAFKNELFATKLEKFKKKEDEIIFKKNIVENLINDSNIPEKTINLLIKESELIGEEFFQALESLEKLAKLKDSLGDCIILGQIFL
jgi:hypothetical protein